MPTRAKTNGKTLRKFSMFNELHSVGVRYGFDIEIDDDGKTLIVRVPAWIGALPDNRAAPILHDLNRALLNLRQNSGRIPVLKTYI